MEKSAWGSVVRGTRQGKEEDEKMTTTFSSKGHRRACLFFSTPRIALAPPPSDTPGALQRETIKNKASNVCGPWRLTSLLSASSPSSSLPSPLSFFSVFFAALSFSSAFRRLSEPPQTILSNQKQNELKSVCSFFESFCLLEEKNKKQRKMKKQRSLSVSLSPRKQIVTKRKQKKRFPTKTTMSLFIKKKKRMSKSLEGRFVVTGTGGWWGKGSGG